MSTERIRIFESLWKKEECVKLVGMLSPRQTYKAIFSMSREQVAQINEGDNFLFVFVSPADV